GPYRVCQGWQERRGSSSLRRLMAFCVGSGCVLGPQASKRFRSSTLEPERFLSPLPALCACTIAKCLAFAFCPTTLPIALRAERSLHGAKAHSHGEPRSRSKSFSTTFRLAASSCARNPTS